MCNTCKLIVKSLQHQKADEFFQFWSNFSLFLSNHEMYRCGFRFCCLTIVTPRKTFLFNSVNEIID